VTWIPPAGWDWSAGQDASARAGILDLPGRHGGGDAQDPGFSVNGGVIRIGPRGRRIACRVARAIKKTSMVRPVS